MPTPPARRSYLLDLALAVVAAIAPAAPAAAQQTVDVNIVDFDFVRPGTFDHFDPTITVGDTVRWVFQEGLHTTTSNAGQTESWNSDIQFPPATFSHTFTHSGTFSYSCQLHGALGMQGVVVVQPVPEPSLVLLVAAVVGGLVLAVRRRPHPAAATVPGGRGAFTVLELLVVIAILSLLLGLLFPAVQRVRESANYTVCRNHLKQISLATQNHEATVGYYPGVGVEPHQESVLARLLPYLELDPLARSIDAARPLFIPRGDRGRLDPAQAAASRTVVSLFLCPSDGQDPLATNYDLAVLAGGNYVANAGTGSGTFYDFRHPTDGVFWYGSRLRHADIVDGISSTMFFAEALRGTGNDAYLPGSVDPSRHWVSTGCLSSPDPDRPGTNPPLSDNMCMSGMIGMTWRGDRNVSWVGGPGHRTLFNTHLMPNDRMLDCATYGLGWLKASSNHPGGVNMVLGDGSVHFIKNHIDLATWRALSTRGVSEAIPSYCGCH
jgi:plastocyanin/type II secretory pathway pseudopilin PulG